MTAVQFGLLFLKPGPSNLPGPPIAHIYAKTYAHQNYRGVSKDLILITPQAMSFRELDGYINQLQKDLETVRKEARRRYSAAQPKKSRTK